MRRSAWAVIAVCCCLFVGLACAAAPYRVLLIDGTKTLEATLRVGGLALGIRQSGLADVTVLFTDEESPFADPLLGRPAPGAPFDLIIIVPRGIGDGSCDFVWLLIGWDTLTAPAASAAAEALNSGIKLAFGNAVRGLGLFDDLWATLTAAFFVGEGWLH
jgi:hypothetical protein